MNFMKKEVKVISGEHEDKEGLVVGATLDDYWLIIPNDGVSFFATTKQIVLKGCKHPQIVMFNTTGKPLKDGSFEVDFGIRCGVCSEELLRIGEYGRDIINLSKH